MNTLKLALRASLAAGGLAALGACTSLPVTADYNPNVGAGACHTYTWAQEHLANAGGPGGPYANPLNADRLRAAIDANMAARGIQKAPDKAAADCVVGFAIGSRLVADEYPAVGFGYGWGGGWGPRRYGGLGWDYPYVREEGRISVDLFDAKTRTAIWHASVNQNVMGLTGPNAEAKINAAAGAIFTKFPGPAPMAAPTLAPAPPPGHSST